MVLNEFGERLFWDHLVNRLSERDVAVLAGGIEKFTTMGEDDRSRLFHAVRQQYAEEFSMHDITNLRLVEPPGNFGSVPVKTSD